MVDLELYRIFKIVADEENLTRASEILNISQPAVTKHIHNLENELELKLFDRTKHGVKLTYDGQRIYLQIKDAINTLINVENSLKHVTMLNLGIHTNMTKEIYRDVMIKLKEKNKNIEINIEKSPTESMFAALEKQEIDAYLSKKQPEGVHGKNIRFIRLGYFHDGFFVNSDSKYANITTINDKEISTIYTLRNISSTYKNLVDILEQKNLNNIEIKNATFNTIIEILQNKDIIAYITEEYIKDELSKGTLKKLDLGIESPIVEFGIYYNSNNKIKNIKRLFENISIDV